jgi:alkylresorcinol/alkylpyrone synthase
MANQRPEKGSYGLMLAMGPGFCSELILVRW